MHQLFLLILLISIVILVLTILIYTKKVVKKVSAGTSNVTVVENNGNAVISVSGGGSGDFLPLSGGTMSGGIDMGTQNITGVSNLSTSTLTLNSRNLIYGLPGGSGVDSLNLYANGTALSPFLYSILSNEVATILTSAYNGENWVFPSDFSVTIYSFVTNYATLPAGFYLNLVNRKASNITIDIYNVTNPVLPPVGSPTNTVTLPASSSRYLYFNGTAFSLV